MENKNWKGIVANKVSLKDKTTNFEYGRYSLIRGKKDILIYGEQPKRYFDDWKEDGVILIVKFYKDRYPKMAYELPHKINISEYSSEFETEKLDDYNKMLTPIFE